MQNKNNLAYDLSLFEPRQREEKKDNIIELPKKQPEQSSREKGHPVFVLATLFFTALIAGTVGLMIKNQVELAELTEEIHIVSKQLSENESIYTQLRMRVESQTTLKMVEEYAHDKLGMHKLEPYQIEYISLSQGDKAEIGETKQDEDWVQMISGMLS